MNALVKKFAKDHFPDAKSDLFACFIERGYFAGEDDGDCSVDDTIQLGCSCSRTRSFEECSLSKRPSRRLFNSSITRFFESAIVPVCTFVSAEAATTTGYEASFIKLSAFDGAENPAPEDA